MPDNPYQLAQKFRAALLRRDADALREITAAYDKVVASLQSSVSALGAQVKAARAAGQTVNAAWLFRERRLQTLLTQAEQQLAIFTAQATSRITNDQRAAVTLAQDHATELLAATNAEITFTRLPTAAIETLVGFSGDGAPLHKLLAEIPGDAAKTIKQTLLTSLAKGINPRQTAREMTAALDGNRARALTIARTETLRAYREAGRQTAERAGVGSWQWIASQARRTCLACLALDGQVFPIDQPQPSHPNCRCTVLYLPPGYNPPARAYGSEWFAKQPDEVKQAMMSKVAFEAYQRGDVKLQDFVGSRKSKAWGETRYERSFKDALKAAQKQGTKTSVNQPPPKLSELPYAPLHNIQVKYYGNARNVLTKLVGREVRDNELAAATAALDDSRIQVFERDGRIMTLASQHWLEEEQKRYLYRNEQGELVIKNALFKLLEYAPDGLGRDAFVRQVIGARALGVDHLETFAAGSKDTPGWNGYYTWPRFGFNASLTDDEKRLLQFLPGFRGVRDLNDVILRGGETWWKAAGDGRNMVFHLDGRRRSVKILLLYLREKGLL